MQAHLQQRSAHQCYWRASRSSRARRRRPALAVAASSSGRPPMGPPPPPRSKPEWVRILEEDAAVDEEVAELLAGTGGDPDRIRAKMQQKLAQPPAGGADGGMFAARSGSDTPPRVTFREVDVFDLWVWLELLVPPSERERELLQGCVRSWFVVGKLGGYNSQNLQVYYNNSGDNSFLEYDADAAAAAFASLMHEASEVEFKGSLARFRVDLGTADELALDVLLNMLAGFSAEVAGVAAIDVGGEHTRWALPRGDGDGDGDDGDGDELGGRPPKVGMNPMKLPQGLEEELEMLDELGQLYDEQQQAQSQARGPLGGGSSSSRPQGMRPFSPDQLQRPGGGGDSKH